MYTVSLFYSANLKAISESSESTKRLYELCVGFVLVSCLQCHPKSSCFTLVLSNSLYLVTIR